MAASQTLPHSSAIPQISKHGILTLHGYGVGQRIAQISGDALKIEEGSLYPGLYRLEQRGWVQSEWDVSDNNQRAKFYKLTRAGRKQLILEERNWERLAGATMKALRAS